MVDEAISRVVVDELLAFGLITRDDISQRIKQEREDVLKQEDALRRAYLTGDERKVADAMVGVADAAPSPSRAAEVADAVERGKEDRFREKHQKSAGMPVVVLPVGGEDGGATEGPGLDTISQPDGQTQTVVAASGVDGPKPGATKAELIENASNKSDAKDKAKK